MAENPEIVLPDGALNAKQIERQFKGKSAVAKVADKERAEVYYFAEDGNLIEVRDGWQKIGKWYARDDGRLCIDLKGEHRDCRMIIKEGEQLPPVCCETGWQPPLRTDLFRFLPGGPAA